MGSEGENRRTGTGKLLARNQKHKYDKYQAPFDNERLHFISFLMTTDGALGPVAQQLVVRLATILRDKWGIGLGIIKTYVKARLAMAIARAPSVCIRGCRTI